MNCPICNSTDLIDKGKNEIIYTLYDCRNCGSQFWLPLKHPGQEIYEAPIFRRGRLQWRQKQFFKSLPIKKGRILDIGCGLGLFLAVAAKKGFEVWGLDISDNNVSFIKRSYGLKNIFTDDLKTFLKRKDLPKFDAVTMFELIEHVEDPKDLLNDVKNLLAKDGVLVISTPNFNRLWGPLKGEEGPPHHFWLWRPKALVSLLERCGFRVEKLIEEPLGRDFGWRMLQRLRFLSNFKVWLSDKIAGVSKEEKSTHQTEIMIASKKNMAMGDTLVLTKDIFSYIITFPVIILGRLFGWKYWDQYVEARLKD